MLGVARLVPIQPRLDRDWRQKPAVIGFNYGKCWRETSENRPHGIFWGLGLEPLSVGFWEDSAMIPLSALTHADTLEGTMPTRCGLILAT